VGNLLQSITSFDAFTDEEVEEVRVVHVLRPLDGVYLGLRVPVEIFKLMFE